MTHLISCSLANFNNVLDLEFISVLPKTVAFGGALRYTGAVLELAAESVNRRFAGDLNVTITYLYNQADRTCEDAEGSIPVQLAEYYNAQAFNRCVAAIASA